MPVAFMASYRSGGGTPHRKLGMWFTLSRAPVLWTHWRGCRARNRTTGQSTADCTFVRGTIELFVGGSLEKDRGCTLEIVNATGT